MQKERVKAFVTQSNLKLFNPKDCSPPGPSVHGILQGRILESGWLVGVRILRKRSSTAKKKKKKRLLEQVTIPFSRRSS